MQFSRFQIQLHHDRCISDAYRCAMISTNGDKIAGHADKDRVPEAAWIVSGYRVEAVVHVPLLGTNASECRAMKEHVDGFFPERNLGLARDSVASFLSPPISWLLFVLNSAQTLMVRDHSSRAGLTHKASISTDPYLRQQTAMTSTRTRTRTLGVVSSTCLVNLVSSRCAQSLLASFMNNFFHAFTCCPEPVSSTLLFLPARLSRLCFSLPFSPIISLRCGYY